MSCPFLLCIVSKEEKCGMNVNVYPCTTLLHLKFNGIPSLIGETFTCLLKASLAVSKWCKLSCHTAIYQNRRSFPLRQPLSLDILVIYLQNAIIHSCLAQRNDIEHFVKACADVLMREVTISWETGVDLCEECCDILNSFDVVTHASRAVTCVAPDTRRNVRNRMVHP